MKVPQNSADRTRKSKFYILAITFVAALGGLLFGYDTGVIGGSQLYFTEYFSFSATQQGWAVGSALFGCLFGAAVSGFLINKFSQKNALLLSAILFTISAWGSGVPESLNMLVIFRIIGGIGLGIASMTAPMYIAEIAPPNLRGRLVSYYQLAIVIGFFVVFVATYFIGGGNTYDLSPEEITAIHDYNVNRGWRLMFWSELIPSSLFFVLLLFVPNSPRWLMLKGRNEEAKVILHKMNDSDEVAEQEYREIERSLKEGVSVKKASPFQPKYRKVLFIGVALSILQQVTGINAILYYGAEIFSNALGYGPEDALKQQILLGLVNLVFTFVAIYSVDKWGRKPLLMTGVTGMLLGLLTVGFSLYTGQLGIVSLVGILVFIASFALSMGPVTWVLLSEIFPNKIRGMAMSIAVAAQWLFNGIVASVFPILVKSNVNETAFNGALPYFIFGFFCVITIVFVYRMIPETKNKSLEELERIWD
ncbi:sugar porter family MFS transporter [Cryomorpha ignava]|uniref:Sugar porter family MFS transporter n=1 Tax=Cryomorpha ignava TaxID=101383 RepID=A0A7K3WUL3_9FLAO|nr:sugar porter family MFS transporter [Cryomorpha ignava]NEN24592.1 sugar porter family MFS transporter [Cryomorpha ignava]